MGVNAVFYNTNVKIKTNKVYLILIARIVSKALYVSYLEKDHARRNGLYLFCRWPSKEYYKDLLSKFADEELFFVAEKQILARVNLQLFLF